MFDWQGHRGCRGLMPENTIRAMFTALDYGVRTLEVDVVITRDRQVLVSHEAYFNHEISMKPNGEYVTAGEELMLNIYQMDYEAVKRFDVGLKPHPRFTDQQKRPAFKPLLGDLIAASDAHASVTNRPLPFYNIELKSEPSADEIYHPNPTEFVELVMDVLKSKRVQDRCNLQSFDQRILQVIKEKYSTVTTSLLIDIFHYKTLQESLDILGFLPDTYSPHYSLVTAELLEEVHSLQMKLVPWTVNHLEDMKAFVAMGVDGIITDYPNLISETSA
jgi:glycerophosphoryl diester phosphodiesterase